MRCGSSFLRMWLFVKKFLINCADLCIKYTRYDDRGIAQLVEHRSPKPSVVSSNLTAPASQDKGAEKRLFFFIKQALNRVRVGYVYQSQFSLVARTIPNEILYFTSG